MFFLKIFLYFSKDFCRSTLYLPYQNFPINCSPFAITIHFKPAHQSKWPTTNPMTSGGARPMTKKVNRTTSPTTVWPVPQINNQQRGQRLGSSLVNGSLHQAAHDNTDRPRTWSLTTTRNPWKNPMPWKRFALHMGYTVSHSGSIRRHRSLGERSDQYRQRQQLGAPSK